MDNKWKEMLDKFRTCFAVPKKSQLLILLLIGILLIVIVIPVPKKTDTGSTENGEGDDSAERDVSDSTEEYEQYLERRVARALEHVEGVGKAEIVITLKSSGQKIIEKDSSSSSQQSEEADSEGGTRSVREGSSDKTSIYEQSSDGDSSPYVSKELSPEIAGVLVIADGGGNAVTVKDITEAIQALFGVEAHKIKIMKRADT